MRITYNKMYFDALLKLVKKMEAGGKNEIKIPSNDPTYTLIFRYCTVHIEGFAEEEVEFSNLDPSIEDNNVISLVFDVIGLEDHHITQVEFVREGQEYPIYVIPDRSKDKIDTLISTIASEA